MAYLFYFRLLSEQDKHSLFHFIFQVLELIGEENVKLSKKQFEEIVEMINKEEAIELEEQLDKVLKAKLKESTHLKPVGK